MLNYIGECFQEICNLMLNGSPKIHKANKAKVSIVESSVAGISVNGVFVSNFSVYLKFFLIKEIVGQWLLVSAQ